MPVIAMRGAIDRRQFADLYRRHIRQHLAAVLQELLRSRGETAPLPFCARLRGRYAELVDPGSHLSD